MNDESTVSYRITQYIYSALLRTKQRNLMFLANQTHNIIIIVGVLINYVFNIKASVIKEFQTKEQNNKQSSNTKSNVFHTNPTVNMMTP